MKNQTRTILIILGITIVIVLVLLLLLGLAKLVDNTSYYENYVAKGYKENIVYKYTNDDIILHFRWINENTTTGPYYLFMSAESLNQEIENIYIENIQIISSSNKGYEFRSVNSWPFLIYNADKKDAHLEYNPENESKRYYEFEDIFNFDFKNGETFKLIIKIRYEGPNINEEEIIEIEYEPYLEELHAPFL